MILQVSDKIKIICPEIIVLETPKKKSKKISVCHILSVSCFLFMYLHTKQKGIILYAFYKPIKEYLTSSRMYTLSLEFINKLK